MKAPLAAPLVGRRIAVTRAATQAAGLARALGDLGADVLLAPAIAFAPPSDPARLEAARNDVRLGKYTILVFTSANGVDAWFAGSDAKPPAGARVAAVGSETRAALERAGVADAFVGTSFVADALAAALIPTLTAADKTLLVRAEEGRETFPEKLAEAGHAVEVVAAYRTIPGPGGPLVADALRRGALDAITFTAGSTVRETWATLDDAGRAALLTGRVAIGSIGPVTTAAAAALGIPETAIVTATPHTTAALVDALVALFSALPHADEAARRATLGPDRPLR